MLGKIQRISEEIAAFRLAEAADVERFRIKYLSKRGAISCLFDEFRAVTGDNKREVGTALNRLKVQATERLAALKMQAANQCGGAAEKPMVDLTRPGDPQRVGSRHPLSLVRREIIDIFTRLGYVTTDGAEIEDDAHNFGMMNFAADHPARDMQDTFFISPDMNVLLRTHTSSTQAHEMSELTPPIRSLAPGRVYRNEAISARAHCLFHQVEGLYVDRHVSFADLRYDLDFFAKEMFGAKTKIRMRPSYFPFTEPSAEVDVSCSLCGGKGCNVCKNAGWLEILGCGMVDPNVFIATGIDPNVYSGFAFGMGIERIAMLKFGIRDIRLFFENDVRFLSQFANNATI